MVKSKKSWRKLDGGPWAGHKVLIPDEGGTMVFSVRGYRGRYDYLGKWHDVR